VCGVSGFWVKHPSGSYSPVVRTPLVVRAAPCSGFWVKHPSGSYTPVVGTLLVVRAAWASRADARFVLRAPASLALICSCAARRVSGCSTFSVVLPCAFGFARRPVFRVRRTRGVVRPCCSEPNFSRAACRDVGWSTLLGRAPLLCARYWLSATPGFLGLTHPLGVAPLFL